MWLIMRYFHSLVISAAGVVSRLYRVGKPIGDFTKGAFHLS